MSTKTYEYPSETGARLNTDNAGNDACLFRDDQDSTLPVQYESITIASSDSDGIVVVQPTGATSPALTEQTTGSPGTGNQHFFSQVLYNGSGEPAIRLHWLVKVTSQFHSNGINIRENTFIISQNPRVGVGGSVDHIIGLHCNVHSSNN